MEEFFDANFLTVVTSLHQFFDKYDGYVIGVGKAIGGVLCLFVVAQEAYQMMLLKKSVDVMALLRPIFIALVLSQWSALTYALREPFVGETGSLDSWAKNTVYNRELALISQLNE